mmetsp:Transcript_19172/g.56970  ORF Transcript_19172/g.56970 Transcript_19172/m.56970 type:complete len:207 (-) Transcript_19172:8-628(-)
MALLAMIVIWRQKMWELLRQSDSNSKKCGGQQVQVCTGLTCLCVGGAPLAGVDRSRCARVGARGEGGREHVCSVPPAAVQLQNARALLYAHTLSHTSPHTHALQHHSPTTGPRRRPWRPGHPTHLQGPCRRYVRRTSLSHLPPSPRHIPLPFPTVPFPLQELAVQGRSSTCRSRRSCTLSRRPVPHVHTTFPHLPPHLHTIAGACG